MTADTQERISELETLVRHHSTLYHNGMPELTDADFDALVDELTEVDPTNAALDEVGALPAFGRKVKHPSIMGSLSKETDSKLIVEWFGKYATPSSVLVASPKIDGLAIRLRYVDGKLVEAATRGDGTVGQDVLDNAKFVGSIPKFVPNNFSGEVRGEVYMKKSVCKKLGDIANPRNGASGGLMQKTASITGERELDFVAYYINQDEIEYDSEIALKLAATSLGFDYVAMEEVDITHVEAYLLNWESERRSKLDYVIDGIVFGLNDLAEQEEAGWNGKRPRGKMAWKFKPEQREAVVVDVNWQVGRSGRLTPVLRIEPTHIDGSTVSNVTLSSASNFEALALGAGDRVLVHKAGDIIPEIVRVVWRPLGRPNLEIPETCPCCDLATHRDGANLWCSNADCSSQLERRVLHWLGMMDVKGAGPGIVSSMCNSKVVQNVSDLYYMKVEDLATAIGSEKIADGIMHELALKSVMPLWKMMAGLGISGLGRTASKAISKKYGTMDAVLSATEDDLCAIDGIGAGIAKKVVEGLPTMSDEITALERVLEIEEPQTGGTLTGMSFCLTGAMSRKRGEIEADILAAGGDVKSSVGKGLTYLVQADAASVSSKTQKAEKFGTQVISEERLTELMEG